MEDMNGSMLKIGDKVEVVFKSGGRPARSCEGHICSGGVLEVTSGRIPLWDYGSKDIRLIDEKPKNFCDIKGCSRSWRATCCGCPEEREYYERLKNNSQQSEEIEKDC